MLFNLRDIAIPLGSNRVGSGEHLYIHSCHLINASIDIEL